ncbi:hypothetical protein BDP55DRAFT_175428 [Colletotrichum godetiae]|uniref:Uncharacterized protein n=1 Tax=Colletotrichum godetiae TaxID=1209918 RepID=A0AAJ0EUL3_9PEZI|nr:uncharacterized protein BDP55DRAFT_175428 [Colletotrichum godetiae]KAK1674468.1 hypothetical protein BDP55DRAFT_175428 [Colletotrichum godetiae]
MVNYGLGFHLIGLDLYCVAICDSLSLSLSLSLSFSLSLSLSYLSRRRCSGMDMDVGNELATSRSCLASRNKHLARHDARSKGQELRKSYFSHGNITMAYLPTTSADGISRSGLEGAISWLEGLITIWLGRDWRVMPTRRGFIWVILLIPVGIEIVIWGFNVSVNVRFLDWDWRASCYREDERGKLTTYRCEHPAYDLLDRTWLGVRNLQRKGDIGERWKRSWRSIRLCGIGEGL